jgi:hypothetical protein
MDPNKVLKLLEAMTTVHRLCRELELPEVINSEVARANIVRILTVGPPELHESLIAAFGGSEKPQ